MSATHAAAAAGPDGPALVAPIQERGDFVVAGDHKVTALMETQRLDQQDPGAVEGAGDAGQAGRGQPVEAAAPVRRERDPPMVAGTVAAAVAAIRDTVHNTGSAAPARRCWSWMYRDGQHQGRPAS
jgi:hypothetical protein